MRWFHAFFFRVVQFRADIARTSGLLCLVSVLCLQLPGVAPAQDQSDDLVNAQKKAALENWKRGIDDDSPAPVETENLLIYGKISADKLKKLAPVLEKNFELARRVLELKKEDLWQGKLTVYLIDDQRLFSQFVRRVEVRRVYASEHGSVQVRTDKPHAVAGPPKDKFDLTLSEQAGAQIAVAVLRHKYPKNIPEWVEEGFGRATTLRLLSPQRRLQERQQVLGLMAQKKRRAQDA